MSKIVCVIGSGGREHAIATAFAKSKHVAKVFVIPGNAGTNEGKIHSLGLIDNDYVKTVQSVHGDLVFVGPEVPLVEGVSDLLTNAGIKCFGPSKQASILESSKAWSKDFFLRHDLPTAKYKTFTQFEEAKAYVEKIDFPVVVKASGLAAGKGVLMPTSKEETIKALETVMVERAFGAAGDQVVVEELLIGEEVSVLAFCDGKTSVTMPPAQDHKRALDGDQGLNTGGMGAYAPAPCVTSELSKQIDDIVQRTLTAMAKENRPFVGVLFAGLMLTKTGPSLLEYNVRMGDPETEAVVCLLDCDLYEVCNACVNGELHKVDVKWKENTHAITVIIAAKGYPESYKKGTIITGLDRNELKEDDCIKVFHAGTACSKDGKTITNGGRVLAVTGVGNTLADAAKKAYFGVELIHFESDDLKHYRTDIGHRALRMEETKSSKKAKTVS